MAIVINKGIPARDNGARISVGPSKFAQSLSALLDEYNNAVNTYGHYNSAHEGWAVIFEELDELWQQVCKKRNQRDPENMKLEALQVAASALRFAIDCDSFCTETKSEVKTGIDEVLGKEL